MFTTLRRRYGRANEIESANLAYREAVERANEMPDTALDTTISIAPNPGAYEVPSANDRVIATVQLANELTQVDEGSANKLTAEIEAKSALHVQMIIGQSRSIRRSLSNSLAYANARQTAAKSFLSLLTEKGDRLSAQEAVLASQMGAHATGAPATPDDEWPIPAVDHPKTTDRVNGYGISRLSPLNDAEFALLVAVAVAIEAAIGHRSFDRVLAGTPLVSWLLAAGVAALLTWLCHKAGRAWANGARSASVVGVSVWAVAVGVLAIVRNAASWTPGTVTSLDIGETGTGTASASMDGVAALLMVAVFLVTGTVAFFAGVDRGSRAHARDHVLRDLALVERFRGIALADYTEYEIKACEHEESLADAERITALAILAELATMRLCKLRAALVLSERVSAEADFTLQIDVDKPIDLGPEARRLLATLDHPWGLPPATGLKAVD